MLNYFYALWAFLLFWEVQVENAKPKPENPNPGLGAKPETRV